MAVCQQNYLWTLEFESFHLFVNKIVYGIRIPYTDVKLLKFFMVKLGDIAVFRFPSDDPKEFQCGGHQYGRDFIKRVIGLPGDKVEVRDGKVFLNGSELANEKYTQYTDSKRIPRAEINMSPEDFQHYWENRKAGHFFGEAVRDNFGPITVPEKSYFVMGDNRDQSCDSRFFGPVPEKNLKGKA